MTEPVTAVTRPPVHIPPQGPVTTGRPPRYQAARSISIAEEEVEPARLLPRRAEVLPPVLQGGSGQAASENLSWRSA